MSEEWLSRQRADSDLYPFLALRACFTARVNLVIKWIGAGNRSVLDIAGGDGSIAERIRLEGNQVTLLDFPPAVARASRYPQIKAVPGEAHSLPFPDASFDLACAMEVLEHYEDPEALVKEWSRVLKPKGSLIITTPDGQEASMVHPTHRSWFTVRTLARLLRNGGLRVRRRAVIAEQRTIVVEAVKP